MQGSFARGNDQGECGFAGSEFAAVPRDLPATQKTGPPLRPREVCSSCRWEASRSRVRSGAGERTQICDVQSMNRSFKGKPDPSHPTTDHDEIRRWAEEQGGVRRSSGQGGGILHLISGRRTRSSKRHPRRVLPDLRGQQPHASPPGRGSAPGRPAGSSSSSHGRRPRGDRAMEREEHVGAACRVGEVKRGSTKAASRARGSAGAAKHRFGTSKAGEERLEGRQEGASW